MVLVSVIIPVYNAEKYLAECLESVISQTLNDIEIICVNDGSTDNSLKILRDFGKKDVRLKIVDQQNKGVSAARNAGLTIVSGKYISFVDGDDWLHEEFLEKLVNAAEKYNAEMVISDFLTEVNGKFYRRTNSFKKNKIFSKEEIRADIFPELIKTDALNSSCNKLFLAQLIIENKINFPVGVTNGEDAEFVRTAFSKAGTALFIDEAGYYYRENQGSASRNVVEKNYLSFALKHYHHDFSELQSGISEPEIEKLKSIRLANNLLALIGMIHQTHQPKNWKLLKTKEIVTTQELQMALSKYWEEIISTQTRYSRFLLKNIKLKNHLMISWACRYANFRNRK